MASKQRDPGAQAFSARKTGTRFAMSPNRELPWDAEEDAHQLLSELPLLSRAVSSAELRQRRHTPLPPPVPDFDDEPSVTPSLRAPKDRPMPVAAPKKLAAKQSSSITDFLRSAFTQRLYGSSRYQLRIGTLTSSKAGGKRKQREPLLLAPSQETQPAILCGWLDASRKQAQVRSYGVMALMHENRYGDEPDISEEEYERFLNKLMDTLFDGGIRLVLLAPDTGDFETTQFNPVPQPQVRQPAAVVSLPPRRSPRARLTVALLAAAAFALGMGAEHLFSKTVHAPSWLQHVGLVRR
ncbi:hypothetical protein [Hyalangium versicolor]|uniref:hypothetical protein n=1 Tax=Hyalangium versicolor TaxID=2861190 RepID=UPI001CCE846A|nr:hypothetical protein [Hyalangium versicolor]